LGIENRTFFSSLFQQPTTKNKKIKNYFFNYFFHASVPHPHRASEGRGGTEGGRGQGQGDDLVHADGPMSERTQGSRPRGREPFYPM
jgi:hypothetical protein